MLIQDETEAGSLKQNLMGIGGLRTHIRTVPGSLPGGRFIGANAMRSFWALGLLITLSASASAAPVHHSKARHVQRLTFDYAVPGWAYAAPRSPVHYDDTPSYNDPSKSGCCN